MFADHSLGLLTLLLNSTPASPCLDAADYSKLPNDNLDLDGDGITSGEIIPFDLASQPRLVDQGSINDTGAGLYHWLDMGAFELP